MQGCPPIFRPDNTIDNRKLQEYFTDFTFDDVTKVAHLVDYFDECRWNTFHVGSYSITPSEDGAGGLEACNHTCCHSEQIHSGGE